MNKATVSTPEMALIYLADCTLATVSGLALLKSRKASEFERQISIAQNAIDWIIQFNIPIEKGMSSRVYEILHLPDQKVMTWVSGYIHK